MHLHRSPLHRGAWPLGPCAAALVFCLATALPCHAQGAAPASTEPAGKTRQEVRDTLGVWRMLNLMTPDGEVGDTPEILANREIFYALQKEVMERERAGPT